MTKAEFAKALGRDKYFARDTFDKAVKVMPSLKDKTVADKRFYVDFTREEIEVFLSVLNGGKGATFEQREKVDTAFVERKDGKVKMKQAHSKNEYYKGDLVLKGTNDFLNNPDRKCCSNCARCLERERSVKVNKIVSPFCSLYNRWCEYMGDVYNDYCAQWVEGKPRYWKKNNGSLTDLPWKTGS